MVLEINGQDFVLITGLQSEKLADFVDNQIDVDWS